MGCSCNKGSSIKLGYQAVDGDGSVVGTYTSLSEARRNVPDGGKLVAVRL
jgi:hypothetical protein